MEFDDFDSYGYQQSQMEFAGPDDYDFEARYYEPPEDVYYEPEPEDIDPPEEYYAEFEAYEKEHSKHDEQDKEDEYEDKNSHDNLVPLSESEHTGGYVKVYHLTSYDNISSIQKNGVLSRALVEKSGHYIDIAEGGALNNHRNMQIDGILLDHFARFFFNPLPPMYYNRHKEDYDDLCVVELRLPFEKITHSTSNGEKIYCNLKIDGSQIAKYYKQSIASSSHDSLSKIEAHDFKEIKWNPSQLAYQNDRDETIAKRGAELLVYPKIPPKYIHKIYLDRDLSTHRLEDGRDLGHPEIIEEGEDD